jgi:hypothetical protein
MSQSRRDFIKTTSILSASAMPAVKTLADAIAEDSGDVNQLADGGFNNALEVNLIDNTLLNLHFYFVNVQKVKKCLYPGPLERSYMIVRLPQMHLSENGFWDTSNFKKTAANLSGFSYLAFELWPGAATENKVMPFTSAAFLDWNNVQYFDLITLVEWFKIKDPYFPYFSFEEYVGSQQAFFDAKSFPQPGDDVVTHEYMPKSSVFEKYRRMLKVFLKLPVAANLPRDVTFVPITLLEIPQGVAVVPLYRQSSGELWDKDVTKERIRKKFWSNLLKNDYPGLRQELTFEIWNNSLVLQRFAATKTAGSGQEFTLELPGFRIVGLLPEKKFIYTPPGQSCQEQVDEDCASQILPSLLDKTELAYLMQYAKNGARDFRKSEYDLKILEGLLFTGLGTITHLSYSNRNCPKGVALIEYEHRIWEGRDIFEKVSRLGYNSKTGQAYKHTIEGQRTMANVNLSPGVFEADSYVRFEQYCECLDPEITYEDETLGAADFSTIPAIAGAASQILPVPGADFNVWRHPFKSLRSKEKVRIPIDCLTTTVVDRNIEMLECLGWFWPLYKDDNNYAGKDPYSSKGLQDAAIPISSYLPCDHQATDRDGNSIDAGPGFMFIRKDYIELANYDEAYASYFKGTYKSPDLLQDPLVERRRTYYNSQKIAFTPSGKAAGDAQKLSSKVNQIETTFTETYFRIRALTNAQLEDVSAISHVVFPQLLQAQVFLDHIKDLTQRKLPSYIEYHEAYLKHQFDEEKNHGAQILVHTQAFMDSTKASADAASASLETYRDDLLNALQQAKDKLGNIVIPDIQPETVSLKTFGITLPKDPGFVNAGESAKQFLDPKRLLPGQFSEILGGLDLKKILNDLLPEDQTPVFQLVKQGADAIADIESSPVYTYIQDNINHIKKDIKDLSDAYNGLQTQINAKKDQINAGLKIIANELPNAEQLKNYINKQFEQYKIVAFDLAMEGLGLADAITTIKKLSSQADDFMTGQAYFIYSQIDAFKSQVGPSIDEINSLIQQMDAVDLDRLPAQILQLGTDQADIYLRNYFLPLLADPRNKSVIDYADKLEKIYSTIQYDGITISVNDPSANPPGSVDVHFDPATFVISVSATVPLQLFDPYDLQEVGLAQLEHLLNVLRKLVVTNSNGTTFQKNAVVEIQKLFDINDPKSYISVYNNVKTLVATFQDQTAGSIIQDATKWKNTYDAFDQTVISVGGRQVLTKIHDLILKTFPWIDTLRQLDPYLYYQQFVQLKKDALDIALRFKNDLSTAYAAAIKGQDQINKAAQAYLAALQQLQTDHNFKAFNDKVTSTTASLDDLSRTVLQTLGSYVDANAQLQLLYGADGKSGLVYELKGLEDQYTTAYNNFLNYVRQNEGQLSDNLSDMVAKVISDHPDDVVLVQNARNIYNLLNSLKRQDLTYTWSTTGFRDVTLGVVGFKTFSNPPTTLTVNVRVTTNFTPGKFPPAVASVENYAQNVLSNFGISLFNIFTVVFSEVSFVSQSGQSPHFAVKIREVQFDGALAFVQKFEEFLKTLDAGLILDLEPDHVALGYSIPIPSIQTPGFAFFNLTLSFDFRLYFDKRPMTLGFSFATAENKFGIAVYIFAGFGFFTIEVEPKRGIVLIDAALEAGVWAGFSLGPIHGEVKLAFGFRYTKGDFGTRLEGYIVAEGRLAIWIIEVSARIYLGIISQNSSCEGSCTVTYSVKLGFFKKSFSGTFYKKISGAETSHQQQVAQANTASLAAVRLMQAHVQQPHNAAFTHISALNAQLNQMQTTVVTINEDYQTETYGVSQQDWDDFFNRF